MASPVPVSAFRAVKSHAKDPLRVKIINLIKWSILFYRWYKYVYTEDGNFTPAFRADICKMPCNQDNITPTD